MYDIKRDISCEVPSMFHILSIAVGGSIGAVLRYLVSKGISQSSFTLFPYGTLTVNLIGCFIIGFCYDIFEQVIVNPDLKALITIGFLGSFTTFSTFSLETLNLMRSGEIKLALLNIIISNICGILLAVGGVYSARFLLKIIK